jgi:hypothetical protein
MPSQATRRTRGFLPQQDQTCVQTAEPDYLDEEVHLGAESIIRSGLTVQYVLKARNQAAI